MRKTITLTDGPHVFGPPSPYAFDLMAEYGVNHLAPIHPIRFCPKCFAAVMNGTLLCDCIADDGSPIEPESGFSVVPPGMSTIRLSGIILAALMTDAEELVNGNPARIYSPVEAMKLMPVDDILVISTTLSELVSAGLGTGTSEKKRPTRRAARSK